MADPKLQQVMDALGTRLKTITQTNGYNYNLGKSVFEGRLSPYNESELPALDFRELGALPDSDIVEDTIGLQTHEIDVEVEIITAAGKTTATVLRKMVQDVVNAIGTDDTFGDLVEYAGYGGFDVTLDQSKKIIGGATVKFSLTYKTAQWEV